MNKFLLLTMTLMILMSTLSIAESDTVWTKEIGSEVKTVKFSPDGQFIYAAAIGRKPMKLSTETGEILKEYDGFVFGDNVFFLAMDISSDGKWLICGAYGNNMYVFDTETGAIVKTLKTDYQDVQSNKFNTVTITPDKRYIIAANMFDGQEQGTKYGIVIWDAQSGELIKVINSKDAVKVEASPDNLHFAVSYNDLEPTDIKIYDIGTWESATSLYYNSIEIQDIAYSPDGSLIAAGGLGGDGILRIWDVNQKKLIKEILAGYILSVSFLNNSILISGGTDGFSKNNILVWNLKDESKLLDYTMTRPNHLSLNDYKLAVADYNNVTLIDLNKITNVDVTEKANKNNSGNIPNPFNSLTEILFNLPNPGLIKISITDANSRLIEVLYNGFLDKGEHKFQWTPKGVSSGIYYCNITGKNFSKTLKIILEK